MTMHGKSSGKREARRRDSCHQCAIWLGSFDLSGAWSTMKQTRSPCHFATASSRLWSAWTTRAEEARTPPSSRSHSSTPPHPCSAAEPSMIQPRTVRRNGARDLHSCSPTTWRPSRRKESASCCLRSEAMTAPSPLCSSFGRRVRTLAEARTRRLHTRPSCWAFCDDPAASWAAPFHDSRPVEGGLKGEGLRHPFLPDHFFPQVHEPVA